MSTPDITKSIVTYKIGTSLAHIHIIRSLLSQIEEQWKGINSATPEFMREQIYTMRTCVQRMDAKMHELDAENRTNPM